MKTKQELYKSFLSKIEKIPKDILNIYESKKENLNGLKLNDWDYLEKMKYLKLFSNKFKKKINNKDYIIWAPKHEMDNGNSFGIDYRSEKYKIINCPFNIIASIPFKYYNIKRYGDRKISKEEEFIIEKILELLEEEGYKSISNEICDIETDIVGVSNMPFLNYGDVVTLSFPEFKKLSKKTQEEFIKGSDYGGPYTIYNVIFGEHW